MLVDALTNLTSFLEGDQSVLSSTYLQQVIAAFPDEADQKSFVLRLVIHYHGDIHQPLHTVSEVDSYYPEGDAGGNYEHIPEQGDTGVTNLHALWDSVIYEYCGYPTLPLNTTDWDNLTTASDGLYTTYPVDASMILDGEYMQWAAEGLQIAKDDVYKDFDYTHEQSQAYLDRAAPIIKERTMYGATRLAQTIVDIYGAKEETFLQ